MKNINKTAFLALIIYPLLIISLVCYCSFNYGFGKLELFYLIISYYVANISVGIGLHRLWSHDTYKTNKYVEFILAIFSAGTLQGPALSWASNHFNHHSFTDKEKDPHTPQKYESKVLGFLWSHFGWMLTGEGSFKSIDRLTIRKLGKNKVLRWQLKHYWRIALFMNVILPFSFGAIIGGVKGGLICFTFVGLGRAIQQQFTFFVNSLCHFAGSKKYIDSTAGDIWWLAIFLLGENWHNYHHAFPSDYRNGAKWYQFDVHKWIIFIMSKLGLAWDLKRTGNVRIEAKINQTLQSFIESKRVNIIELQNKVNHLRGLCLEQISMAKIESTKLRAGICVRMKKIKRDLNNSKFLLDKYLKETQSQLTNNDFLLKAARRKISRVEYQIKKISLQLA